MEDRNRVGQVLQVTAIILFCLITLAGLIVAIETESFLTFLIAVASAFLSVLLLYAIGEILHLLQQISNNTEQMIHSQASIPASPAPVKNNTAPVAPKYVPATAPVAAPVAPTSEVAGSAAPQIAQDGRIICPKCGKIQNANRKVCFDCGTLFVKE